MADSLKNDIVGVTFTAGEQPSPTKLTSMVSQLNTAVEKLNKAIGDLYNQQTHTSSGGAFDIDARPLVGPSVGRSLGSLEYINPMRPDGLSVSGYSVNFVVGEYDGAPILVNGSRHYNRHQFFLPFRPLEKFAGTDGSPYNSLFSTTVSTIVISTPDVATGASDATSGSPTYMDPASRVSSINLLNAAGEWHCSDDGLITVYSAIPAGYGFKVTYDFDIEPEFHRGAGATVIPSFRETTNLCTVAASGADFTVTFPNNDEGAFYSSEADISSDFDQRITSTYYYDAYWWEASLTVPHEGQQYQLPYYLRNAGFVAGDIIPDGLLQIYDDTNNEILAGGTFKYLTDNSLTISGLSLTASSDRYRIITAGTSIAASLANVVQRYRHHQHDGLNYDHRVSHRNLLHNFDEGTTTKDGFSYSSIGIRNQHPQYFHRYGYQYGEAIADGGASAGNRDNAFLGHLVISAGDDEVNLDEASYGLFFGSTSGPYLGYTGSAAEDDLEVGGKRVFFDDGLGSGAAIKTSSSLYFVNNESEVRTASSPANRTKLAWDNSNTRLKISQTDVEIAENLIVTKGGLVTQALDVAGSLSAGPAGDRIKWAIKTGALTSSANQTISWDPGASVNIIDFNLVVSGPGTTYTNHKAGTSGTPGVDELYVNPQFSNPAGTQWDFDLDVGVNLYLDQYKLFIVFID